MLYSRIIENEIADHVIKVYDPETKQVLITYESEKKAYQKLGITKTELKNSFSKKVRFFSPTYKKELTCRLGKREPDMVFTHGVLEQRKKITNLDK